VVFRLDEQDELDSDKGSGFVANRTLNFAPVYPVILSKITSSEFLVTSGFLVRQSCEKRSMK
jgi:hypothetical protein